MNWTRSFLDNNSRFGQLMTRCGILIAGNLLFLFFSLPIITIGASWTALSYTMMKTLRQEGEVNPFRTFWEGFRENWKQATAAFWLLAALGGFLLLELFWCSQASGWVALFRYGLLALLLAEGVVALYLFPVMAAFRGTLTELARDCVFFAVRRPVTLLLLLFAHSAPVLITYLDAQRLPLYAFLWCLTGFSGIAMYGGSLLLRQFSPLLDRGERGETPPEEQSEQEILEEMNRLGM